MKPPQPGFLALVLADLAGFGLMALAALALGVTANTFRHEPLPLFATASPAEEGTQPTAEISMATLQDLSAQHAVTVIDARPASFYALGHIPGALNLPYEDFKIASQTTPSVLPASKLAPLVVYCSDVSCPAAKSTARILQGLGYRNVSIFAGGWYFWKRAGLPIETSPP